MAATISANSAGGGGLVTSGDASGVLALQTAGVTALSISAAQVVSFTNAVTLTSATLTSPTITGAVVSAMGSSVITSGTVQASTSGTSINFTSIPSWAKRITMMFNGVVCGGNWSIQLGTGGVLATTGYQSSSAAVVSGGVVSIGSTTGICVYNLYTNATYGSAVFTLIDSNKWVCQGAVSETTNHATYTISGGTPALSGVVDKISILTSAGAFTAGSINIMYE